jgi:phenylalanyl-tRNA synthetase beta chain
LEYVETDRSPQEISNLLTMAGIEVGDVVPLITGLQGVVVAEIEAIEREVARTPTGQPVMLCKVSTHKERFSVISGAPNLRVGARGAFAPPGALLPPDRRIEARKIRGVMSQGMLCSEAELGIGEHADGIFLLPDDAPPGTDLIPYLGLDDSILSIEVTPNRPDCLSVVGVAREVAVLVGAPFRFPSVAVKEGETDAAALTSVTVEAPDLCPRYAARIITDVTVGPSPPWLAQRLRAVGLRPINNVVDATNYVLWELGHPLHAFDYKTLAEHRVVVRRARAGESLRTLDGQRRKLTDSMLVIAGADRAVGLAGVMGGASSEVTARTQTVLLESAYFSAASIRRTARTLGLQTEASYRFERGADIEGLKEALDRTAQLIADLSGGVVARGAVDIYPSPEPHPRVPLRLDRIRRVVGDSPPKAKVVEILRGLGFPVEEKEEVLEVVVPTFRRDVALEDDLVEEVIRIWGYDRIPSTLPTGALRLVRRPRTLKLVEAVRDALVGLGLHEVVSYSFVDPAHLVRLGLAPADPTLLRLANPLSQERSVLRPTLAVGLIETVATNAHRQLSDVRCFEVGRVFNAGGPQGLALEDLRVGIVMTGLRSARSWYGGRDRLDFHDLKGVVEGLLAALGHGLSDVRPASRSYCEDGRAGELSVKGEWVGIVGELRLSVCGAFELPHPVYLAELSLDRLGALETLPMRYRPLPRFPGIQRDLALVVPLEVTAQDVERVIREVPTPWIQRITLFDVYTGDHVAPGKKSLAYSIFYQAEDRTLTDEEVNTLHERILARLTERFSAEIRGRNP